MLKLQDLDVKGKKVLMRVDFNVPLTKEGAIADDTRIRESLPSILSILERGGSVILMSHLGRPKGKDSHLSLSVCTDALSQLLKRKVIMAKDCIGAETAALAHGLKPGDVLLLENLRFYPAEEKPDIDPSFSKQLASLGDLYVNDAFGTAHRNHSSTAVIAQYFPHKAAAGLLLQKEIRALSPLITHPKHPFYAIIGGAKISTKIGMLLSLLSKVDALFIGGAMAFTFFKQQHIPIGDSPCEEDQLDAVAHVLKVAKETGKQIYLPKDLIIANAFQNDAERKTIPIQQGIPEGWQGLDIGPETIAEWKTHLTHAATVFWNGPVGAFEMSHFAHGTQEIAKTLAHLKAVTIVGGGDSVLAINQLKLASHFTHVSTGGGASLEYIEFGHLPGIDALEN